METNKNTNATLVFTLLSTPSLNNTGTLSTLMMSALERFSSVYHPIHGVLAPIVCVMGTIANCLNIVVLTRRNMLSPTNVILTWLAVSDGLTMIAYFPYILLNYHIFTRDVPSPFTNANYVMFFAIFSVIVHSISIWLTVILAAFRYVVIAYPRHAIQLCSVYRARVSVAIVCFVVILLFVPNSISYSFQRTELKNQTSWYIDIRMDTPEYQFLKNLNLWIQAFVVKLIPCCLVAILSMLLIREMKNAEKNRKKLLKSEDDSGRRRLTNRTTRMLVAVVALFVLTETPQGILLLLGCIADDFFNNVYLPLGDLADILVLFNNSINFVLFCSMSKQFRDTFFKLFISDVA